MRTPAGSTKSGATADLFAGWGIALNGLKDYSGSNDKLSQAIIMSTAWNFPYDVQLSVLDLHILKAENYFVLSDFTGSLTEVKFLNALFDADVLTGEGIVSLAKEIERLKGIYKPRL